MFNLDVRLDSSACMASNSSSSSGASSSSLSADLLNELLRLLRRSAWKGGVSSSAVSEQLNAFSRRLTKHFPEDCFCGVGRTSTPRVDDATLLLCSTASSAYCVDGLTTGAPVAAETFLLCSTVLYACTDALLLCSNNNKGMCSDLRDGPIRSPLFTNPPS